MSNSKNSGPSEGNLNPGPSTQQTNQQKGGTEPGNKFVKVITNILT